MSKAIMAECLEEAQELWERFSGCDMLTVDFDETVHVAWTQEVATLAVALYQERMRHEMATFTVRSEPGKGAEIIPVEKAVEFLID